MIFATFNQLNCFLIFIFLGLILGLISNVFFILFLKNYQKNIVKIIFDSIFYAILSILFIFLLNYFNLGEFSISLLLAYTIGIKWTQILGRKTVVFFETKWYTYIKNKTIERKKRSNERKLRKS